MVRGIDSDLPLSFEDESIPTLVNMKSKMVTWT